jgi:hypothetical protein
LPRFVAKAAGIENVDAHPEFLGGLLGDGQRIPGHHLDDETICLTVAMAALASSLAASRFI